MRTNPVRDVVVEAHDDPSGAGQVVVRLKGATAIGTAARFRLKLIDAPLGDAQWPDTEHVPIDILETRDGVNITIGAELAGHPMLAPGTAVLIEIGDMRGEFLWPAVTPVQQPKRKRIALRVVPPPPVVSPPLDPLAHSVSTAVLDFERTNSRPTDVPAETVTMLAAAVAPVTTVVAPDPMPKIPVGSPVAEMAPAPQDFTAAPSLATFRHISKTSDNTIPAIFSAEEWPTSTLPSGASSLSAIPAVTTSADRPISAITAEEQTVRPVSDVFPTAHDNDDGEANTQARPTRLPPPTRDLPADEAAKPSIASSVIDPPTRPAHNALRAALARLDRMPAIAAAALGFTVLSAIAAVAMLWPSGRSVADARGVGFQDQRRWQDGQLQKPAVVRPSPAAAAEPAVKATAPPPVVTASVAAPEVCGAAEPKVTALPAGMMSISFRAACRRQQAVTLSYGSLEFKRRFDADGGLDVTIDCILGAAMPVVVSFSDGKSASVPMSCRDLDRVSKVAVVWRQPIDLDLHVFERPGAPGTVGQISGTRPGARDTARDLSTTERAARGFLSSIGSATSYDGADGVRMTVYTAFHPPQTTTQTVPIAVDFATRGETPAGDTCIGGRFASPAYEIVRLTARGQVTREDGQFAAFACGAVVAPTLRFNQSLHAPLRIRN